MAEEDKIKYKDIIEPDDSIEKLVAQLGELNKQYETMVKAIRAGADRVVHSIKAASGATSEGRKAIDDATASTSRLERAQKELKLAMSDTGKQIAWLKAQTIDQNKATVEQQRYLKQAASSYDRLKSDLKQTVETYKSLTAAERADSEMGDKLLNTILSLKNQIKALDNQMKPHIQTLTEVEKAERKLAFLNSAEGKRLLELKAQIAEITRGRKSEKAATDPLTKAQEKLAYARDSENRMLKLYTAQIKEANKVAELEAIINSNAEGSYNRLAAQYALNKIELNKMSGAQREAEGAGKRLEAETNEIYQQMIKLQEATGNYRLSVGHYQKTWDGLGFSISQVVRELPAATVSLNTFFLGISNNIPMVVDEINRLREQNRLAQAEGKKGVSITKSIVKSLLSFNTVLVVGLTLLSEYGEQLINWIDRMLSGKSASLSMTEAMETLNEELSKSSGTYGKNISTTRRLADEWKRLGNNAAEQQQWIKDNQSQFSQLDVSINNVNDASKVFVDSTDEFIEALKARAKAEAALNLLSKQYAELLALENKAEVERTKDYGFIDNTVNFFKAAWGGIVGPDSDLSMDARLKNQRKRNIESINTDKTELQETIDNYFKVYSFYIDSEREIYKKLGISDSHKKSGKGRTPRDAEDTLESLSLAASKAYQKSLTELEREEIKKRRKEYLDAYNIEVADLNKKYNKIQRILDGHDSRYKKLTEEQKNQAIKAQEDITSAIINKQKEAETNLDIFGLEEQIHFGEIQLENLKLQAQVAKEGSEEELRLKLEILKVEQEIAIARNRQLPPSQRQDEDLIKAGYTKQAQSTVVEYGMESFDQQQALEEARFNVVKHNEAEITRFKLEQEKARWEKQIRLAELGGLDWSKAQIDAAKETVKGINRELSEVNSFIARTGKRGFGGALLESLGLNEDQIGAMQTAVDTTIGFMQQILDAEIRMAEQEIALAQKRVEAAEEAYKAEIDARNKGYANNVVTAKRELEQEKKRLREKEKLAEDARKKQEAVNTIMQANSLVTASALIWSQLGFPWAIPAIGVMWASFAAAKIKASQITSSQSDEYGEGGLEFLEGGSHASGHDINLGVRNKKKRNMKAEGGEALAIINKKQTAKYKGILPDIISSLNKGTFEDKYSKAFDGADKVNASFTSIQNNVDLSRIEGDLSEIRKQNEVKSYSLPDGTIVIERKNLKRIIKN